MFDMLDPDMKIAITRMTVPDQTCPALLHGIAHIGDGPAHAAIGIGFTDGSNEVGEDAGVTFAVPAFGDMGNFMHGERHQAAPIGGLTKPERGLAVHVDRIDEQDLTTVCARMHCADLRGQDETGQELQSRTVGRSLEKAGFIADELRDRMTAAIRPGGKEKTRRRAIATVGGIGARPAVGTILRGRSPLRLCRIVQ